MFINYCLTGVEKTIMKTCSNPESEGNYFILFMLGIYKSIVYYIILFMYPIIKYLVMDVVYKYVVCSCT